MLVLLPPSEGKTAPVRGRRLDLDRLAHPELNPTRRLVLDALVGLCGGDRDRARQVLGLSAGQVGEVDKDAALPTARTAAAEKVYSGVLYAALGLPSLTGADRRRASSWLLVTSGLFGLVRPSDPVPAYRLAGDVSLPGVGSVASRWRGALAAVVPGLAGGGPVLDLRSSTYVPFWRPTGDLARRTVSVRVLQDVDGVRRPVSHFNKATKGRLVRSLLTAGDTPRSATALVDRLGDLGWTVERRSPTDLDVLVTDV